MGNSSIGVNGMRQPPLSFQEDNHLIGLPRSRGGFDLLSHEEKNFACSPRRICEARTYTAGFDANASSC